jgi:histidyl-tRNA synthetase
LRRVEPELRIRVHAGGGKLKNQLKRADQCGAAWAVILGADELAQGKLTLKALATGEQVVVTPDAAAALIAESAPGAGANPREGADVRR